MNDIIVISGGFDPIHSGHIDLIRSSAKFGKIVVLLNSNEWLIRKKNKFFMDWEERSYILKNINNVIDVIKFDDSDDTAIEGLKKVKNKYKSKNIFFANGGDRTENNTPEKDFCNKNNINEIYEVGGGKTNASSDLLKKWSVDEVKRSWGYWQTFQLFKFKNSVKEAKFKKLTINSGKNISYQKHSFRNEIWLIISGKCEVIINDNMQKVSEGDIIEIKSNNWHTVKNTGNEDLEILEVQYGNKCDEEDIERR